MKNKIFTTFIILLLTSNAGYCLPLTIKNTIVKFSFAMAGVVISSLLIFVGLTVYNKIRSKSVSEKSLEEEVLRTPKSKDDAISFFIRKNKLK